MDIVAAIIWLACLGLFLAGLVWAVAGRIRQKRAEDFEQRNN